MDRLIGLALCAGPIPAQTDKYFTNTSRIVAANGDSRVTFAVFMRRRVVAGAAVVLGAAVLLVAVPLVALLPGWGGAGAWLVIAGAGALAVVVATLLERGRAAVTGLWRRLGDPDAGWE